MVLAIADGEEWRFISLKPEWQFEKEYFLRTEINKDSAKIFLNGELKGESKGYFAPYNGEMLINYSPLWGRGRVDYLVILKKLKIKSGKGEKNFSFPQTLPQLLFEPQCPQRFTFDTRDEITIEGTFEVVSYPDLKKFSPFIDRYGQSRYGDWVGKTKKDEDLRKAYEEEEKILNNWDKSENFDQFGGYKLVGWREEGTGFYRVVKKNGFWWLITPEGNPCFYIGLCAVPPAPWEIMTPVTGREFIFEWLPPKDGAFAEAWGRGFWGDPDVEYVCFHTINLIRKYGTNWKAKEEEMTRRRLRSWGFSGCGKWGVMEGMPYFPVLYRGDVPSVVTHPDIFDPDIRARFRESLRKQIEPRKNDPFLVGWSLGNEYDEIITKDEIKQILAKPNDTSLKKALLDYASKEIYKGERDAMVKAWGSEDKPNPPDQDLEKLRCFYAERYYEFIYNTVKEIDPNHLFLGFWIIPGWWEKEDYWELFKLSTKYCDVIGYNLGAYEFMSERFKKFVEEVGKPIICGDFSFPPFYNGERGFGIWGEIWAKDDVDAGELYKKWVKDAGTNPYCVGVLWFLYRDQPITGRGPCEGMELVVRGPTAPDLVCGEHYAFGMVDITDMPKWELVKRVRESNLSAVKERLSATVQE